MTRQGDWDKQRGNWEEQLERPLLSLALPNDDRAKKAVDHILPLRCKGKAPKSRTPSRRRPCDKTSFGGDQAGAGQQHQSFRDDDPSTRRRQATKQVSAETADLKADSAQASGMTLHGRDGGLATKHVSEETADLKAHSAHTSGSTIRHRDRGHAAKQVPEEIADIKPDRAKTSEMTIRHRDGGHVKQVSAETADKARKKVQLLTKHIAQARRARQAHRARHPHPPATLPDQSDEGQAAVRNRQRAARPQAPAEPPQLQQAEVTTRATSSSTSTSTTSQQHQDSNAERQFCKRDDEGQEYDDGRPKVHLSRRAS